MGLITLIALMFFMGFVVVRGVGGPPTGRGRALFFCGDFLEVGFVAHLLALAKDN